MGYKVFCLIVFVIQTFITFVDFLLARKHHRLQQTDAELADILAGISWCMTAGWWLYQAFTAPIG